MKTRLLGTLALALAACQQPSSDPAEPASRPIPQSASTQRERPGQPPGRPHDGAPAKAPEASFAALLTGSAPVGARVTAEVLVWPETVIETTTSRQGEPDDVRHYLLVTAPEAPEAAAAAALAADIEAALPELDRLVALTAGPAPKKAADQEARHKEMTALLDRYDALLDRYDQIGPPKEGLVALRLERLDAKESGVTWSEVARTVGGATMPAIDIPKLNLKPLPPMIFTLEAAEARLTELEAAHPPALDEPLPRLQGIVVNTYDRKEVNRYNALVGRLNAEIDRRARHMADTVYTTTRRMAFVLRRGLYRKHTLSAEVTEAYASAVDTWRMISQRAKTDADRLGAPVSFLAERPGAELIWAQRIATGTDVFLATVPAGAEVTMDGEPVGKTPLVLEGLPVGAKPELAFSRLGYEPYVESFDIPARHQGVYLVSRNLTPKPPEPQPAKKKGKPKKSR